MDVDLDVNLNANTTLDLNVPEVSSERDPPSSSLRETS